MIQALKRLKQSLKRLRGRLRAAYFRRFRAFGPEEFGAMLRRLGVERGDILMVHSSFDRFEGFPGSMLDAIRVLEDAVGPEGTLPGRPAARGPPLRPMARDLPCLRQ